MWSFHDLLFHRQGLHTRAPWIPPADVRVHRVQQADQPAAAGFPEPAGTTHPVAVAYDAPLSRILEERRSVRRYGPPLPRAQLELFLHRISAVQSAHPGPALTFHPVVGECTGLPAGLYRYDATVRQQIPLAGPGGDVDRLLVEAMHSAGLEKRPQVLLVLTARRWARDPYANVLRQVGACFQRMYLLATAMRLAPCALGCGDADAFARAAGLDHATEPAVGEFLLGTPGS
jgi:SagB-type dehydrogenase family enzyme